MFLSMINPSVSLVVTERHGVVTHICKVVTHICNDSVPLHTILNREGSF